LDVLQLKRSPGVSHYAHILHATTDATIYRLFGLDYFDSVLLTGPYQAADLRKLEALRGTRTKRLEVVGCTYLDVLATKLRDTESTQKEKTVLVAPSWGSNGILSRFGMKLLAPLADSGYRVIIRPHPQSAISEKEMLDKLHSELDGRSNIEWNFERENLAAMARANVLISDFSGIIFDYAFLFGRPVLYPQFVFDPRPYDAADIDGELWTFRTLREIGAVLDEADFPRIGDALDALQNAERRTLAIDRARDEAYSNPGSAGKRTVDVLIEIRDQIMKERA
jgi:CDP-glycerol glycerophosphotransferase (TagB/SpsB family)